MANANTTGKLTQITKANEEIVRQSVAPPLKFKNSRKVPLHRLPFVDFISNKGIRKLSCWTVPRTGGYFGGNEAGLSIARIYLKYLKSYGRPAGGLLQHMVLDMLDLDDTLEPSTEQPSLRGQIVGLLCELEEWLCAATRYLDGGLDELDEKILLKAANNGLNLDDEAYLRPLSKEDEYAESEVGA